jgi:LuxR family maltose regulon positive regulatory protein
MGENSWYFSKRLLDALRPMLTNPLTVVEAPTGYGKTVAVTEFLHAVSDILVVTASAKGSGPESFWPDFCRALAQDIPEAADASAALQRLGLPRDFAQRKEALGLLRSVPFTQKTFLVFDDCHFLPLSFIHFCESLSAENLPNLHVVCVTRHAWAGSKKLPHQKNALSSIDQNLFALTPPEICELYALYGVPLELAAARELHTITEGWISALNLSVLWHKDHGDLTTFPKDVAELIQATIYAPLSAEARNALFSLAPLERFTAEQASWLHGTGVTELLEELTSKNAFVTFDHKSRVYSIHPLFRKFLLELFQDNSALADERKRAIYRGCGEVLLRAGELASAMDAWHKAGEFERALTVLENDMSSNLVTERAGLYVALFRDCPQEILERHTGATFKYALAAFSAGDFQAFGTQMAWLAKRCATLPPGKEGDRWRGELHVLLALTKFNDIEAMSAHHRQALALLNGATDTARTTSLYSADSPWTLGSPSVLFMFYRESGKLQDALRQMRERMQPYYALTSFHGAGAEWLMEAEALYCAGEFEKAEASCESGLEKARRHNQLGNEFCAAFLNMRLSLVTGDAQKLFGDGESKGLVAAMREMIVRNRDYYLLHTADVCEGWLYALLGLEEKIPYWLRVRLSEESPLYAFARGYYFIVHGRALLLAGKHEAVVRVFKEELQKGEFHKNLLFSVYAHIYLAAALSKTNQGHEAASALKIALDIALPDALYMPFAENHDLIGPLLPKALFGREHKKALSRTEVLAKQMQEGSKLILKELQAREASIGESGMVKQYSDTRKFYSFVSHYDLTEKEIELLSYIFRKLNIKEIAGSMDLSEHGIKFHISNILSKTNVKKRRDLLPLYVSWKI